ncbi:MAG: DUF4340 domain-containing protein [Candidatus Eisenbacteria bacterium]|uniref:DUF4340 domain-containing protein n=1 Tax=Eiseniibacteriota bacterium TaxID=2212470 RepID=A0A956M1Y8_UNCEI|nr:DUF4340 domain-containing protein [Candidatus Eisenbacteria bacterium]
MNARTTILLGVILVILGVVATLTESNRKKQWKPAGNKLFPAYEADRVDQIDIDKGNLHVALAKKNGQWVVATEKGMPADTSLVNSILGSMRGLSSDDLVSTKGESHAALEVDSTGVNVDIKGGGQDLAHLIVGKPGPDYMSTYIRPTGQDNVYRVPVYLRTQVDRGDQTWRNKTVLKLAKEDLASYTTQDSSGTVTVEQTDGEWKMTAPREGAVRQDLLPILLQSLTNITARDFADSISSLADVGLDPAKRSLEIVTTAGAHYKIDIGDETEQRQNYVKREGNDTVFLVPAGRWNTVFRPADELAPPEAPAPAAETTGAASGD